MNGRMEAYRIWREHDSSSYLSKRWSGFVDMERNIVM